MRSVNLSRKTVMSGFFLLNHNPHVTGLLNLTWGGNSFIDKKMGQIEKREHLNFSAPSVLKLAVR